MLNISRLYKQVGGGGGGGGYRVCRKIIISALKGNCNGKNIYNIFE